MTDGYLPAARERLHHAVTGLCEPQPQVVDGVTQWVEGLYRQLSVAVFTQSSLGGAFAKSRPPLWIDAEDLLIEIDTAVCAWLPRPIIDVGLDHLPPITIIRLEALQARKYRPQDVGRIDQASTILEQWTQEIIRLLTEDDNRWRLPAPCLACGVRWVYRDDAGDRVRQPALRLTTDGCTCLHCHEYWPPSRFSLLAAALGYPLPEGVTPCG